MPNDRPRGSEQEQAAIIAELRHRTRNTLATTRMIVRRSAEASATIKDYVAHLDGRLSALGRVQTAAYRNPFGTIDLDLLVRDELASLEKDGRITIDGAAFPLRFRAAELFALIIHELLTNAIKFGALASHEGRLSIAWRIEDHPDRSKDLSFDWIETGVTLLDGKPSRKGFGMVVLREMADYSLGAQTAVTFQPTGLAFRLVLPISARIVIA